MEDQLGSSGKFSRTNNIAVSPKWIPEKLEACQLCPEELKDRIIFKAMFNDIDWTKEEYSAGFFRSSKRSRITQEGSTSNTGHSSVQLKKTKWHGTHSYKPEGKWNTTADIMVDNFKDSGHPLHRATSAVNRGVSKRKGGRCTVHFIAESPNAELFRTMLTAKRLSIHGAVASWCGELTQLIPGQTHLSMEKSVAKVDDQLSQKLKPQEVDSLEQIPRRNDQATGNRLCMHLPRFEDLSMCSDIQLL